MSNTTLEVALELRNRGISVFPVQYKDKRPGIPSWLEYTKRLPTTAEIEQWFSGDLKRNLAIVCGQVSGLLVLDADNMQGIEWVKANMPHTPITSVTAHGAHFFYRHPSGVEIPPAVNLIPYIAEKALDLRADGSYVVAPPSEHETGVVYRFESDAGKNWEDIPVLPAETLTELMRKKKEWEIAQKATPTAGDVALGVDLSYTRALGSPWLISPQTVKDGERNTSLAKEVGSLLARYPEGEVALIMAEKWNSLLAEPLPPDEFRRTFNSIDKKNAISAALEWGQPVPFDDVAELPKLDLTHLPAVLGDFCGAVAESVQVPAELVFSLSLACIATAAQRRFVVQVADDYSEQLSLFTMCCLPPANRKSAALSMCQAPIIAWRKEMLEKYTPELRKAKTKNILLDKAIANLQNKFAKNFDDDADLQVMQGQIDELEQQKVELPAIPKAICTDTSPEAIAAFLYAQGECAGVLSTEQATLQIMGGLYNGKSNIDTFLAGWSGDYIEIERKNAPDIELFHPRICLGIATQPSALTGRQDAKAFRERGLDGRFLYLLPKSLVGYRNVKPPKVDAGIKKRYHDAVYNLLPQEWSITIEPLRIRLSEEANALRLDLAEQIEVELRPGGAFANMADWGGKLLGSIIRIAGIFHLLETPFPAQIPISLATMQKAVALVPLLVGHAQAAYGLMGQDARQEGAKHVLVWIKREGKETFTERDCFNAVRGSTLFPHMEELRGALAELMERGFIRELPAVPRVGAGRKPSVGYSVNPACLKK